MRVRSTEARLKQLLKTRRYMLLLRDKSQPRIVHIRIILKYASTHSFIQVLWPTKPYHARSIELLALLAHRGEQPLTSAIRSRILKFCQQQNAPVAVPAAFYDAVIAHDGTLTLGFLAFSHPVVVQITQRGAEHFGFHFNDFHRPHRLLVVCGELLRSATGHDEERGKKKACEHTSLHENTSTRT